MRWKYVWEGFKKGPFVDWETAGFMFMVGVMGTGLVGHYIRDGVFWPELLFILGGAAAFLIVRRQRQRRALGDQMRRASAAVRETISTDTRYVLIMADSKTSGLVSNIESDEVLLFLNFAKDQLDTEEREVH